MFLLTVTTSHLNFTDNTVIERQSAIKLKKSSHVPDMLITIVNTCSKVKNCSTWGSLFSSYLDAVGHIVMKFHWFTFEFHFTVLRNSSEWNMDTSSTRTAPCGTKTPVITGHSNLVPNSKCFPKKTAEYCPACRQPLPSFFFLDRPQTKSWKRKRVVIVRM